jgi:thioredoxin-disulfide reductase
MSNYDVIIIGGGPAGLAAALYTARRMLTTLVLTKDIGGQTSTTLDIENYPGVDFSTGPDLMNAFAKQAKKFGAIIEIDGVTSIAPVDDQYKITTESGKTYIARAIILATGKHHRKLDVSGEEEFLNRGVVYCATCDAPLFADKPVAVVGGGSAAFDAALLVSKFASKVYLVHRRDEFKAEPILVERAKQDSKIEFVLNAEVVEIKGDTMVAALTVKQSNKTFDLEVKGVFAEIGQVVDTQYIADLVDLNEKGEILLVDRYNATSRPGIFAAGDATTIPYKQTIIGAGEGAIAGLAAYDYLQKLNQN